MSARRFGSSACLAALWLAVALQFGPSVVRAAALTDQRNAYEQHLGETLPLNTAVVDDAGQTVRLGSFFQRDPVVLIFGYWRCPQLCSVISNAAIETLRELRLTPDNQFTLLYVSIDPTETPHDALVAKERDVRYFAHAGADARWHYLTGPEANIRAIANAAGFHYTYDPESREYAHPSGLVILTPSGTISRYFFGVDFPAKDVATAIHRARAGETGPTVFDLLLLCFHGQGITGRYGKAIWHVLQFAVGATVLGLGYGIGRMLYQERHPPSRSTHL